MSRFAELQDPVFQALNASISFDIRLAPYDIEQSRAHARMLARCGVISGEEAAELERGLEQVHDELEAGSFEPLPGDEDVHMAIERRVTEIVGPVGGKLHTARSRNDQIATDVAMFVRGRARVARDLAVVLMATLADLAARHLDWSMPAYTHLQRAQPVYLSHHLLAWFWKLERDRRRFRSCVEATSELPLGSGALAGVNFETDRAYLAGELGFERPAPNSLDAVANRDFVLDYLAAAATCATHLSQLGAELVLWSSEELGFCELSDAFTSGSSLMPQKKNPDAAELLRAKAPRVAGHLVAVHGVLHGLPLTYNKDLQEDKEHLFDAADTIELCLRAADGMLRGVAFRRERMATAASDQLLSATDLADLLVKRGVPFREAHGMVGTLVRRALERGVALSEVGPEDLEEVAPQLTADDLAETLGSEGRLESKVSEGGTALARVREQLERAGEVLAEEEDERR